MNLSNVVTRLKLKLGLLNIATPFDNIDDVICTIINEVTLPVFSLYCPYKQTITMSTNDLEKLEKRELYTKYLIPESLFSARKIIYVFDVRYDDSCMSGLGYYGGGMPLMTGNIINQAMLANASSKLLSQMIPKMTFKYEAPRTLFIYNLYSSSKITVDFGFEQDKSLASIPETARESFMDLAILDLKENLYPTLKMYSEINTAIGNINLKIDDWANAESDRKELINKWDDTYHMDMKSEYYI